MARQFCIFFFFLALLHIGHGWITEERIKEEDVIDKETYSLKLPLNKLETISLKFNELLNYVPAKYLKIGPLQGFLEKLALIKSMKMTITYEKSRDGSFVVRAEYELIKKDNINESGDLTFQYLKLKVPTTDKENRIMEFRSYSFGIYPINSIMKSFEIDYRILPSKWYLDKQRRNKGWFEVVLDLEDYKYEALFEREVYFTGDKYHFYWDEEKMLKLVKKKTDFSDGYNHQNEVMRLTFSKPSEYLFIATGFLEGSKWWGDGTEINFILEENSDREDGETFAGNMTVTDYAQGYINKTAVEYLFFRKIIPYYHSHYHFESTSELMKEEQITLDMIVDWPNKTINARIPKIELLGNEELEIKYASGGTVKKYFKYLRRNKASEEEIIEYPLFEKAPEDEYVGLAEEMIKDHTFEIKKNDILSHKMTINFASYDDVTISIFSPEIFQNILQQTFETLEIEGKLFDSYEIWKTNFWDTEIISALKLKSYRKCRDNRELEDCINRYNLTVDCHGERMLDFSSSFLEQKHLEKERIRDQNKIIWRFDVVLDPSILCKPSQLKELCIETLQFYLEMEEKKRQYVNFNPKITVVKYGETKPVIDGSIRVYHPRIQELYYSLSDVVEIKTQEELFYFSGLFFGEQYERKLFSPIV